MLSGYRGQLLPDSTVNFDALAACTKFAEGKLHSGENGEGTVDHLADVKVPTLIYGSQGEYNCGLTHGAPAQFWPYYPSVFEQLGSTTKELYVDNTTANPNNGKAEWACLYVHVWFCGKEAMQTYCDGKPLAAVTSFLRRTLKGSTEPVMEKPANAKEWVVKGAAAAVDA